jgi:hypothetical protein
LKTLDSLVDKALSRRSFLAGAGVVAAGAAVTGCSSTLSSGTNPLSGPTPAFSDTDILNYALNLEYLEAQFYLYAATGSGLASSDTTGGTVGSAAAVPGLTPAQQQIINEIAYEEQEHVKFLRSGARASCSSPDAVDRSLLLRPVGVAAGITPAVSGFNPFSSFDYFLVGAFIFEDVGVTAYCRRSSADQPRQRYLGLSHRRSRHPRRRGLPRRLHPHRSHLSCDCRRRHHPDIQRVSVSWRRKPG